MLSCILVMLASSSVQAQNQKLQSLVDQFTSQEDLTSASIGIAILDLSTGQILAANGAGKSLAPASTLKVVTTAGAITNKGADYTYKTQFGYRGSIVNGVLQGDLIIKGSGDPSLGSKYVDKDAFSRLMLTWTKAVEEAGINKVAGKLILDASIFDRSGVPGAWQYQDLGNYYAAGSYGINVHDNQYFLTFKQGAKQGDRTKIIAVSPEVPNFAIENYVSTGAPKSGDQAYIYSSPGQQTAFVEGTIPPGQGTFTIRGSLPDPSSFLAHHLREWLAKTEVLVEGPTEILFDQGIGEFTILQSQSSPTLRELIRTTNKESVNLYAECLGKTIGSTGDLLHHWEQLGCNTMGVKLDDFSGLSKNNLVTAQFMVDVLYAVFKHESYADLKESLAIAGVDGTMKHMLKSSVAKGKVYGKSGLISGVRTYIGYMEAPNGRQMAFALLAQNFQVSQGSMRRKWEGLIDQIYRSVE